MLHHVRLLQSTVLICVFLSFAAWGKKLLGLHLSIGTSVWLLPSFGSLWHFEVYFLFPQFTCSDLILPFSRCLTLIIWMSADHKSIVNMGHHYITEYTSYKQGRSKVPCTSEQWVHYEVASEAMFPICGKMDKQNISGYGKIKIKVKLSPCLIQLHVMKTQMEMEVSTHIFFTCFNHGEKSLVPTG